MRYFRFFLFWLTLIVFVGCGGGGGAPNKNPAPVIVFNAIPSGGVSQSILADETHTYQYTLQAGQFYQVTLTTLSGDADLFIFNSDTILDETTLINESTNSNTNEDLVNYSSAQGEIIYIAVYGFFDSDYHIEVTTTTNPNLVDYLPDGTCPSNAKTLVPVTSFLNAEFTGLDTNTVTANSIILQCNGVNQSGVTTVNENKLSFAPDMNLPQSANCMASIDNAISDQIGNMINNYQWSFQTSSTNLSGYVFPNLENLTSLKNIGGNILIQDVYTEGDNIAIAWVSPIDGNAQNLFITFSKDGGRSYTTSPNIAVNVPPLSSVTSSSVKYRNGKLHVAWRFSPVNMGGDILYSHSTTDLFTFSAPIATTIVGDDGSSIDLSLEIDSQDNAYILWQEDCKLGVSCDPNYMGIYLLVIDPSNQVLFDQKVGSNYNDSNPHAVWVSDHLIMSWRTPDNIYFKKYQNAVVTDINTFAKINSSLWKGKITKLSDSQAILYWTDRDFTNSRSYVYYTLYDGLQLTFTAPVVLDASDSSFGPIIEITPLSGNKAAVIRCDDSYSAIDAKRELIILDLNVQSKVLSHKHTEMLNNHPFINNPYDSICPKLGTLTNDKLFTVFKRGTTTNNVLRFDMFVNISGPGNTCQ